jgi:hypothetical protein
LEKPNQIQQYFFNSISDELGNAFVNGIQHEIGLKSLTFDGLRNLMIKDIVVAFTCLRSQPEKKKDRITLIVSGQKILQDFLKSLTLKPSGLGALLSLREKKGLLNFFIGYRSVEEHTLRVR